MPKFYFTSESVTEGHPDKVCDTISDAVVDALLAEDPYARIACETAVKDNQVYLLGEISSTAVVDFARIVRQTVAEIGYTPDCGFCADSAQVTVAIREQSPDIALGVDRSSETKQGDEAQLGAGDQGMMFGYACDETPELMPLPVSLAHKISRNLAAARKDGVLPFLRPDGKSQVTVEYRDGVPARIDCVVVSAQHTDSVDNETLRRGILENIVHATLPADMVDADTKFYINPTGRFVTGGPVGDSGLTGRKIIVDTYGGMARHGGGAFSGKDPTKVDRSGAYMARYIAKNVVAAGLARRCELQLAYAIGVARPVSVYIDTFGTEQVPAGCIQRAILEVFDMRPQEIIRALDLRRPIYRQLAAYGHVGRTDLDLPWERTDKVEQLQRAVAMQRQPAKAN